MLDRAALAWLISTAVLMAGPALAAEPETDGVISTSRAVAAPMTTDQKIETILAAARAEDEDAAERVETGPRQIHGSAGVAVGSGGYRGAFVSALIPVGERGMVGVAYSQSQGGRGFGPGMGPGFGGAPGMSSAFDGERRGRDCPTTESMRERAACETPRD